MKLNVLLFICPVFSLLSFIFFGKKRRPESVLAQDTERPHEKKGILDGNHIVFLSLFRSASSLENGYWQEVWTKTLGRPYKRTIDELVKKGLLAEPTIKQKLDIEIRVSELKQVLREHGLKVSGDRDELIARYVENLPDHARESVSRLNELYICTKEGMEKVRALDNMIDERRARSKIEVRGLLAKRRFDQAAKVIKAFYGSLPSSMPHSDPQIENAKTVLDLKSVPGIDRKELERLKLDTAASVIWGEKITGPKAFVTWASFLIRRKNSLTELEGYREQEMDYVEIMCCEDSCPKCRALAGNKYALNRAPILPVEGCRHENGCRCCYAAGID